MRREILEVKRSFEQWNVAHARFVRAVKDAHGAGFTWRELGDLIGRSHEYMRSVARHKLDR